MGSILSAIDDDVEEYLALCARFGQVPQHADGSPDCCGAHAKELKKRATLARRRIDALEDVAAAARKVRYKTKRLREALNALAAIEGGA